MPSKVDETYLYVYVSLIVKEYEKYAAKSCIDNLCREQGLIAMHSPIAAMEMVVDSAERTLKGENLGTATGALTSEPEPEPPKPGNSKVNWNKGDAWWGSAEWRGFVPGVDAPRSNVRTACDKDAVWSDSGVGTALNDAINAINDIQGVATLGGFEVDHNMDFADAVNNFLGGNLGSGTKPGAMDQYMEKCWSCFLDFNFNWELPPVNLLAEIDKLLQMVKDLLKWILARSKGTYDFLKDMCNWDWMFKLICIPDILALLAMLRALLMKYAMDGFNISLDWTGIVGPIIKAVMDALCGLLEAIVATLIQPIDCVIGIVKTVDALIKGVGETVNDGWAFMNHLWSQNNPLVAGLSGGGSDPNSGFEFSSSTSGHHVKNAGFSDIFPEWSGGFGKDSKATSKKKTPAKGKGTDGGWSLGASAWELKGQQLGPAVEAGIFKAKDFNALSGIVLALEEVKAWIKKLAYNIIMALKSLTLLFSGSLKLQIMKSGLIMLIIDFIQLIRVLWEMLGSDGFCEDEEGGLADAISAVYGEDARVESLGSSMGSEAGTRTGALSSSGQMRITNIPGGFSTVIQTNECVLSNEEKTFSQVKTIFDAIKDDSLLKKATMGI